jgi:4-amino-4-deoxy-L-arabinose transferase
MDPDEGLHAAISQEMLSRGDFVVPRFLGEPFLDKPILFFWSQCASMRLFGENETAARLPGLVFGALGAITTGWLAASLLGVVGWWAALAYTTMLVPIALMEVPVHDIALVPFVNVALLGFWRASRAAATRDVILWSLVAGAALGGAMLTKGFTGVAIVGLAHVAVLLLEHRLTVRVVAGGVVALGVGAAIALPWYLAMERATPGYLHYYLLERHVSGFASESQRHASRPWSYYIPVLAAGGLPWVL